jgi:hypothetical protein
MELSSPARTAVTWGIQLVGDLSIQLFSSQGQFVTKTGLLEYASHEAEDLAEGLLDAHSRRLLPQVEQYVPVTLIHRTRVLRRVKIYGRIGRQ